MNTYKILPLKAALLAAALVTPAIAVDIADQPITTASTIKPNLMFILDDSGSMSWAYMPDTAFGGGNCRGNTHYNTIAYNPGTKYDPPLNALGASFPNQVFTAAENDGFNPAGANTDLTNSRYYIYNSADGVPPAPSQTCKPNADYISVTVGAASCVVANGRSCATGADERTNYANWFSYYRTRMLMMKSGIATAFSTLDDKYRVGFSTLHGNGGGNLNFVPVSDFDGTQKNAWYNKLYGVFGNNGTPLHTALNRAGQYFSGAAPYGASPDPMQFSCQKNFAILSTDGYWNSQIFPGNWDRTVPAAMPLRQGAATYNPADTGLTEGANFPRPYYEGPTADSDSLADVAMKYWVTDLRTAGATAPNNVQTSSSDPAYWQHMNTITVGLGVNGTLVFPDALAEITAGTANWPDAVNDSPRSIDDLWHAAVNGRGSYYKASDPTSLKNGLAGALRAITDSLDFAAAPSSSTNDLSVSDLNDFVQFVTPYRGMNWSGDVQKFNVARTTGLKTGTALWSASKQIDLQYPNGGTQWQNRKIVTKKPDGSTVRFEYAELDSAQQTALCYKATPTGACVAGDTRVVDYLRGDSTYEGDYGVAGKLFRNRKDIGELSYYKRNLIGDIVDFGAVYIAAEPRSYIDATDHDFSTYKLATLNRAKTVYAGSNNGMLHAFDASTGDELWAYVPSFLIRNELDTSLPTPRENGLRALSYQDNGDPSFMHHYYVNGASETGAVNFNHVGSNAQGATGNWHTILVGGLGKGGKGYFALDVTEQTTDPIGKVLWEFPRPADATSISRMGYSFGKPIIAKTQAYGWVVMLPSGYNNADGKGYLFVLNAKTGVLLETLATPTAAPGMAHVTAFAKNYSNAYAEQAYAGDLNGNIWRFDFGVPPLASRVKKIFESSALTPIATEVTVAEDENTDARWVFAATGQYLNVNDRANTDLQYLIGIRDGTGDAPAEGTSATLGALTLVTSTLTGSTESALGWKYKLQGTCAAGASGGSERGANKPKADLRTVVFTTMIAGDDPCSPGVCGNLYGLEYSTGKTRLNTPGGAPMASDHSTSGYADVSTVTTNKGTASGKPVLQILRRDGTSISVTVDVSNITSSTRHVGWREVLE